MAPELNWTSIAETFIKSLFGYLSKKRKSRRSNGDHVRPVLSTGLAS